MSVDYKGIMYNIISIETLLDNTKKLICSDGTTELYHYYISKGEIYNNDIMIDVYKVSESERKYISKILFEYINNNISDIDRDLSILYTLNPDVDYKVCIKPLRNILKMTEHFNRKNPTKVPNIKGYCYKMSNNRFIQIVDVGDSVDSDLSNGIVCTVNIIRYDSKMIHPTLKIGYEMIVDISNQISLERFKEHFEHYKKYVHTIDI